MTVDLDSPATITIVDDEPTMQDVLVRAVRSWGYPCQTADDAEQALQLLRIRPTPLVVTDLRMPGQGGVWLVRKIHENWPQVGIVVVTAGADSDAAMDCLNAGADRYFLKPLRLDEFRHALETILHTVELEQERERYRCRLEQRLHEQMRRVRRTFLSGIDSLIRTLEARHPYTKGHSLRVRHYALRLAWALDLDRRQRRHLSLIGKLHDIGKVGVPEDILNKSGPLTPSEREVIREHPVTAERILSPIIRRPEILAAIRGHHERMDGKGYPDGLRGEEIPLFSRVIAIADAFDAMTSSRAYRHAMTPLEALQLLREGAGRQFDPELVQAFLLMHPHAVLPQLQASALS
jgi:putative two-component system response regulator